MRGARELLLAPDFLSRFAELQHPVEYAVAADAGSSSSTINWLISTEGIPGLFRGLVGRTVPIRLVMVVPGGPGDKSGSINIDVEGKVRGQLRTSLQLSPGDESAGAAMTVQGELKIHAGPLGGKASSMARDHLILPILGELADLLDEWCVGSPS